MQSQDTELLLEALNKCLDYDIGGRLLPRLFLNTRDGTQTFFDLIIDRISIAT